MEDTDKVSKSKKQSPIETLGIDLNHGFLMLVAGRSNTGKSHFIHWFFSELRDHFDYGVAFSNTAFTGGLDYIPQNYIYDTFDEQVIDDLIAIQKDMLEQAEYKHRRAIKKGKVPAGSPNKFKKVAFVLLDDCCVNREFHSEAIQRLATQGRHYNIVTILSTQYIHLAPPAIRGNTNYGLFFDIGLGVAEIRATYEWIGGKFGTLNDFKDFYYDNVGEHRCIMFHRDDQAYRVFRAPAKVPDFTLRFRKHI